MPGGKAQTHAERGARLMDDLSKSFANELRQVVTLLTERMRTLVKQIETDGGRAIAKRTNLALALQMKADILKALNDAGYTALAQRAADESLDRLARHVLSADDISRVQIGTFDVDVLAALKQLRLADLLQVGEDVAVQLWRAVVDGVVGARPVLDLVGDIADLLDISEKRARQIYDTAVSTFSRQVGQLGTTGEPDEVFIYVGPVDQKVREFCLEHVGKVYTREVIDGMDNGQLPNVMLTGGGYNCRHIFSRVSRLDKELLALVNTGKRATGVQKRIEDSELEEAAA
jgi:hypothetical protein